jgi:5'-3' exonuclease
MIGGKVVIDGDIIAYRAAFSTQGMFPEDARSKVDDLMEYVLEETLIFYDPSDYEVYLTGSGNFRYDIAKSFPYKENRSAVEKPVHLPVVREHLIDKWGAIVSEGEEADDLIGIAATKYGPDTIVASIDKDMLQLPCKHFNFVTGKWTTVSEFEGLKAFYKQILTGDRIDNIVGLFRVGPVKAEKMLEGCDSEESMWETVLKAYDGDVDRVVENARLLWLRRKENELWEPPNGLGKET